LLITNSRRQPFVLAVANKTDAVFTATPDASASANPIDSPEYFVRQQYLDFLSREPDQGGSQLLDRQA